MILYLDTSALIKLYVDEPEGGLVRQWAEVAEIIASSRIALLEVLSTLARRRREGTLNEAEVDEVRAAFGVDWPDYAVLDIDEIASAAVVQRHPIRSLDAIHLAAALTLNSAPELGAAMGDAGVRFASFDLRQRAAAAAEGLTVLPADPYLE